MNLSSLTSDRDSQLTDRDLLLPTPDHRFQVLVLEIADRNSLPMKRVGETAKLVANLSVILISAVGFPFGDVSDLAIRCFVLGDTAFKAWSGVSYVNSTLELFTRDSLLNSRTSCLRFRHLVQISAEITVAVLSHLPGFLNTSGIKNKPLALIEYLGDVFFRMYSMRLLIQLATSIPYYVFNSVDSKIFFLQLELVETVKDGMKSFVELPFNLREQFVQELQAIRGDLTDQRFESYLNKLTRSFQERGDLSSQSLKSRNIRNMCIFLAFAILPVSAFMVDNWQESNMHSEGIGRVGAAILAALPLCTLHLTARCIRDTFRSLLPFSWNITTSLSPVKSMCYKALGLGISILGTYGFLKSSECSAPPALPRLFCLSATGFFFVVFHVSIRTLIENSLQTSILSQERDEERMQMLVSMEYKKLSRLIRGIPTEKFVTIFHRLPNEMQSHLLLRAGINRSELNPE